jgi:hypothetical protein
MLDPKPYGQQTIEATFSDFGGTVTAVNGLYNPLSGGNLYRGNNALLYVDYASDDVMSAPNSTSGYSLLDYFEQGADNQQSFDLWADLYRIIYRANIIIERVPGVTLPLLWRLTLLVCLSRTSLWVKLSLCVPLPTLIWCACLEMFLYTQLL